MTYELPSHCAACGVSLQGGATVHLKTCPWYPISYYALTKDENAMEKLILDLNAYEAGFAAGQSGKPDTSCPYPASTRQAWSWHSGYVEGHARRPAASTP